MNPPGDGNNWDAIMDTTRPPRRDKNSQNEFYFLEILEREV